VTDPVAAFAAEVGPPEAGPVAAVGGRTQWAVGLAPTTAAARTRTDVHEVRAPAGVVRVDAADMTVRVRAGTTVAGRHDRRRAGGRAQRRPAARLGSCP
jgi:hypothetical protein